jgi:hypothetical protein
VKYGDAVLVYLIEHKIGFVVTVIAILTVVFIISRILFRHPHPKS